MAEPRNVLNRLRWDGGEGALDDVVVFYRHHGAPDDTAAIRGGDIVRVGRTFLDLPKGGRLPQHRILRIEKAGRVVWDRFG